MISSTNEEEIKSYRQKAIKVLRNHPELKELLTTSDQWYLYSLNSGTPYDTEKLKLELIDLILNATRKTGVADAVHTCNKLLTDAADQKLEGFEFTFFAGIKLTKRWDMAPGLYVIPYKSLQQFEKHRVEKHRVYSSYDPFMLELDQRGEENIAVLVREFRWGPMIVSNSGRRLEDEWPVETIFTYNHNSFLIIPLLAIILNHPLRIIARTLRSAPWIENFLGRPAWEGVTFYVLGNSIAPLKKAMIKAEDQKTNEKALKGLESFTGTEQSRLSLAIMRLSTSLSRSGPFVEQDKVLDISIALEILYKLDKNEITYKLSTRAGWYLGRNASERLQTKKTIGDFYGLRSAIIHGREDKNNEKIYSQAFDIAKKTLLKHLSRKNIPSDENWNKIVMGQQDLDKY